MLFLYTTNRLAYTKWNYKYHIVFAPKHRRKVFYEEKRADSYQICNRFKGALSKQLHIIRCKIPLLQI